jgi:hypothetical protein
MQDDEEALCAHNGNHLSLLTKEGLPKQYYEKHSTGETADLIGYRPVQRESTPNCVLNPNFGKFHFRYKETLTVHFAELLFFP